MLEVFRKLGSIQFDPLAVAGRTHDLVLHARVADYDPAWCDLLYERREIFEAYNKGLSFVPASEFPWFRATLSQSAPRVLAENAEVAERVLDRIRAEGPLSALDFERERGATTDWFGMPTNAVRAVLEAYTVTGVFGLARRDGNRRYYDLLERLLPADLLARDLPLQEQLRHRLLSRYRAHGLLGVGGGGGIFSGIGSAKPSAAAPGTKRAARGAGRARRARSRRGRGRARQTLRPRARRSSCWRRRRSRRPPSRSFPRSIRWSGTAASSAACSTSTTCGSSSSRPQSAVGAGTCCRSLPRPLRRPDRAADRPGRRPRADARRLVGERLRASARRGVRRRDARRAPRLPALRSREPPRVGTPPPN